MTAALLQKWLTNFNSRIKKKEKKIKDLLILNITPCHKAHPMSNIPVAFLSPDCTGFLQSWNAGIIQLFKTHYRKHQVHHIIKKNPEE